MTATRLFGGLILAIAQYVSAQSSFPYHATQVLYASNSTLAYIVDANPASLGKAAFSVLDLSSGFSTKSDLPGTVISDTLPFVKDGAQQAYTAILDPNTGGDVVSVWTGDCSQGAAEAVLWGFTPAKETSDGGVWTARNTSLAMGVDDVRTGANFLSGGVAFASGGGGGAQSSPSYYIFGGMCPSKSTSLSSSANWVSSAQYSNKLLALTPGSSSSISYSISTISTLNQPIAEAGFSMTALASSSDSGAQGILLVGGHTQSAFLNMSQVAVLGLPQQSWTFFPVKPPTSSGGFAAVEPRSGHSAVLSEDGSKLYIFGGWVGEITNAAHPQFAILHLGPGYGGNSSDSWSWEVPTSSTGDVVDGGGRFGHGAAMLPGGIMMIAGGFAIPASPSSPSAVSSTYATNSRRDDPSSAGSGSNILLYDTNTNSWSTSYNMPDKSSSGSSSPGGTNPASPGSTDGASSGPLGSSGQQTGIGVGIGLGVLLLVALIIGGFWFARRWKPDSLTRRRAQIVSVGSSESGLEGFLDPTFVGKPNMRLSNDYFQDRERIGSGGYAAYPPYIRPEMMSTAGATGAFQDIPSPKRGLRKGLANRPYQYHAVTPQHPDYRVGGYAPGAIHPIVEREDEDDSLHQRSMRELRRVSQDAAEQHQALMSDNEEEANQFLESARHMDEIERSLSGSPELADFDKKDSWSVPSSPGKPRLPDLRPISALSNPFLDPVPNPLGSHPLTPAPLKQKSPVPPPHAQFQIPRRPNVAAGETSENWTSYMEEDAHLYGISATDKANDFGTAAITYPNRAVSPVKTDDRTSSTLSDRSFVSQASSGPSITRTLSTRTGALLAAAYAARQQLSMSTTDERLPGPYAGGQTLTQNYSTETFATARSSVPRVGGGESDGLLSSQQMQSRMPASLAAVPKVSVASPPLKGVRDSPNQHNDRFHRVDSQDAMDTAYDPYAPMLSEKPATTTAQISRLHSSASQRRHRGANGKPPQLTTQLSTGSSWVNSLRRALTAMSTTTAATSPGPSPGMVQLAVADPFVSANPAGPMRQQSNAANGPRRTVSTGSTTSLLLKQRRGQRDWPNNTVPGAYPPSGGDNEPLIKQKYSDDLDDWGVPRTSLDRIQAEGEWDVEGAAASRDVQILGQTFTIPRTRLRVVNADLARKASDDSGRQLRQKGSNRSVSDSIASRAESLRRREREALAGSTESLRHADAMREEAMRANAAQRGSGGSGGSGERYYRVLSRTFEADARRKFLESEFEAAAAHAAGHRGSGTSSKKMN